MLSTEESFFFDQVPFREPIKRYKKNPDELPQSLRYAHLNPKLASFYKDSKNGEENGAIEIDDVGAQDSILPEISNTFANIRNQLLTGFMPDFDSTRLTILESKTVTPTLLEELAKLLSYIKLSHKKLSYPRSLEQNLQSTFDDLVYDAKHVKRQWQVLENQLKYDAEQKEKTQKEAAESKAEEAKKSRLDGSDTDEDIAKLDATEADQERVSKSQRRKRHRQTQSQPTVIIEDAQTTRESSQKKGQRTNSGIRKPSTAPGKHEGSRLGVAKGDDMPSETSHSMRSGLPVSYAQPYSMTVLAFNLSNYQSWESKGCHVFGIDRDNNNEHPLEWVVKRLNQTTSQMKLQQEEATRNKCRELPFTRYYTDTATEKSLAKSAGDRLGIFNTVMKGGKPKIPNFRCKQPKGQMLCTQITDGSRIIYYEGGEIAVVKSRGADSGFYTLAYDKDKRMLACFTPLGTGCCYNAKNTPLLLVTATGGFYANDDDDLEEWTWPSGAHTKLSYPINVALSRHISIKIVGRSAITLTFQLGNHVIKTAVGLTNGLESTQPPSVDELFPLQMSDTVAYTSHAAQGLILRISNAPSVFDRQPTASALKKSRTVKTPKRDEAASVEFTEGAAVVQFDMSKVERDYSKLKNKAKNLVDEWLDVYRIALGIASPQFKNMKPSVDWSRQGLHTAKSLPPTVQNNNADELASTPIPQIDVDRSPRVPSAPSGFGPWMHVTDAAGNERVTTPKLSSREKSSSNTLRQSKSGSPVKLPVQRERSTPSCDGSKLQGLTSEWTVVNHYQCPVLLRQQLLGINISGAHNICKCTRRRVPYLTDVELETFISKIVPRKQLIVVSTVSSLFPEKNGGDELLDKLHNDCNANRAHVCMQSRADAYRLFRYDVVTAYFDSTHTQPLLLTRHNAVPGMFLIFQSGRLIFCDHIFNGYGNTQKDFQKQLLDTRRLALRGFSLPRDFKFSPQKGRQGMRSPWGGQIGGAGVDKHASAGVTVSMPKIGGRGTSPDSVSSLEYHIGKHLSQDKEDDNVHTSKSLVRKLTKKYTRFVPPTALVK